MSYSKNAFVDTVSLRGDVAAVCDINIAATNRPRIPLTPEQSREATTQFITAGKTAYFEGEKLLKEAQMSPAFDRAKSLSEVQTLAVHMSGTGTNDGIRIDQAKFLKTLFEIDPKVSAKLNAADAQFTVAVTSMAQHSPVTVAIVKEFSGKEAWQRFELALSQHPEIEQKVKGRIKNHEERKPKL